MRDIDRDRRKFNDPDLQDGRGVIVTASIVIIFYVTIIIGIGLYHYMGAYNG